MIVQSIVLCCFSSHAINIVLVLLISELSGIFPSPITVPLKENAELSSVIPDYFDTKKFKAFHTFSPDLSIEANEVMERTELCQTYFKLKWSAYLASPVYNTPVTFSHPVSENRQIFISTFYEHIEILNADGFKPAGWPISFEDSSFQSSPILYDIDGDSNIDIGIVDKNGNMFWVRTGNMGEYLEDYHVSIPRLKVKRNWADGIDADFVDSYVMLSMFDHYRYNPYHHFEEHDEGEHSTSDTKRNSKARVDILHALSNSPLKSSTNATELLARYQQDEKLAGVYHRRLQQMDENFDQDHNRNEGVREDPAPPIESINEMPPDEAASPNVIFGDGGLNSEYSGAESSEEQSDILQRGDDFDAQRKNIYAAASYGDLSSSGKGPVSSVDMNEEEESSPFPSRFGDEDTNQNWKPPRDFDDGFRYYGGAHRHRYGYGANAYNESEYLFVDAHFLATPTLADIDGDGHMEILFSVSYYFDKVEYSARKKRSLTIDGNNSTGSSEVAEWDFDPDLYVAGGIACWNMESQDWTWLVHLDLTTAKSKFQAMIYSSPTVADLDGDGRFEVIVGTALGLLYVLDGDSGFVRRFFPMQFHAIEAQIAVADVAAGSHLEMIVADLGGTLAVVSVTGDVLWDRQLSGRLPFTPTIGDVDGDGLLDIVVVAIQYEESSDLNGQTKKTGHPPHSRHHGHNETATGSHLWILRGDNGESHPGYPISLPGHSIISSSAILVDLQTNDNDFKSDVVEERWKTPPSAVMSGEFELPTNFAAQEENARNFTEESRSRKQLHIIVTSFEGHVYIIDPNLAKFSIVTKKNSKENRNEKRKSSPTPQELNKMCMIQKLDVSEHIYSTPLIEDVTGDGYLDLVVGTLNGQVLLFESNTLRTGINKWSAYPEARLNGFTAGVMGISVPISERIRVSGLELFGQEKRGQAADLVTIHFEIVDNRDKLKKVRLQKRTVGSDSSGKWEDDTFDQPVDGITGINQTTESLSHHYEGRYTVSVARSANKLDPLMKVEYTKPGYYSIDIKLNPPETTLLILSMTNEHGLYFEDSIHVSLCTKFYTWFKYMIIGPVVFFCFPLLTKYLKYI